MSTTTVVITETRPSQAPTSNLSISVTLNDPHSNSTLRVAITSSISGDLDDHTLVPSGTDKKDLIAEKPSYQVQAERD